MRDEIGDLRELAYRVTLIERAGVHYAYVDELNLVAKASDPESAYAQVLTDKDTYLQRMCEMGLSDQVPRPSRLARRSDVRDGLSVFAIKTSIVGVIALILGLMSLPILDAFLVQRLASIPKGVVSTIDKGLDKVTAKLEGQSDEERALLNEKLRARVRAIKPLYTEVISAWQDTTAISGGQP